MPDARHLCSAGPKLNLLDDRRRAGQSLDLGLDAGCCGSVGVVSRTLRVASGIVSVET
jgi:hypothetical protein